MAGHYLNELTPAYQHSKGTKIIANYYLEIWKQLPEELKSVGGKAVSVNEEMQ